ncbi:MAG: hypothetical protein ACYCPS_06260 [Candidatus Saccharimonadales bacterium]
MFEELGQAAVGNSENLHRRYDRQDFTRSFGHYPSRMLTGRERLKLSETRTKKVTPEMVPSVLRMKTLESLLRLCDNENVVYKDVIQEMERSGCFGSVASRHLMWLMKYGFVELVEG